LKCGNQQGLAGYLDEMRNDDGMGVNGSDKDGLMLAALRYAKR